MRNEKSSPNKNPRYDLRDVCARQKVENYVSIEASLT